MGQRAGKAFNRMLGRKEVRLLIVGLDAAGKTTILHRLKYGITEHSVPTLEFNVESIQYGKTTFRVWDLGGQEKIREFWRHYFTGTSGVIFVIDSSDAERMRQTKEEFFNVVYNDQLGIGCVPHASPQDGRRDTAAGRRSQGSAVAVLIMANKMDLPNAMTVDQIHQALQLDQVQAERPHMKFRIQPTVAITGQGLQEGLEWLANNVAPI